INFPCFHKELEFEVSSLQLRQFAVAQQRAVYLANTLNKLYDIRAFQGDMSFKRTRYPSQMFYALAISALESDPQLVSSAVAFIKGSNKEKPSSAQLVFAPYAYRGSNRNIYTTDLASLYHNGKQQLPGTAWFTYLDDQ
ncbi:unnamed protein product, partial [Meganyctiphanes norvegica]